MNIYSVHIVTSANEAFLCRPLLSLFTQRVSNSVHIVGWNGFENDLLTLSMLCQIVVGPQFQNFTFDAF